MAFPDRICKYINKCIIGYHLVAQYMYIEHISGKCLLISSLPGKTLGTLDHPGKPHV